MSFVQDLAAVAIPWTGPIGGEGLMDENGILIHNLDNNGTSTLPIKLGFPDDLNPFVYVRVLAEFSMGKSSERVYEFLYAHLRSQKDQSNRNKFKDTLELERDMLVSLHFGVPKMIGGISTAKKKTKKRFCFLFTTDLGGQFMSGWFECKHGTNKRRRTDPDNATSFSVASTPLLLQHVTPPLVPDDAMMVTTDQVVSSPFINVEEPVVEVYDSFNDWGSIANALMSISQFSSNRFSRSMPAAPPQGIDPNWWAKTQIVEYVAALKEFVAKFVRPICSDLSCPIMSATLRFEYRWDKKHKVTAPKYCENFFGWADQEIRQLPPFRMLLEFSNPPEDEVQRFWKDAAKICTRAFRIFAHIYTAHLKKLREIKKDEKDPNVTADMILNTLFKHFFLFVNEHKVLVPEKEHAPLKPLIERVLEKANKKNSGKEEQKATN